MFKPIGLAYGTLATDITAASVTIILSPDLYNKIAEVLGEDSGDITYLLIGDPSRGEIVRVENLYDGLVTVSRARDGTTAKSFNLGTSVQYYFCASAVRDMLEEQTPPTIEIYGQNGLTVDNPSPGKFYISGQQINIESSNGTVIVGGGYPNYDLAVDPSAFGLASTGISP